MRRIGAEEHTVALTLDKWIAMFVAGCLVALTLILRTPDEQEREISPRLKLVRRQEALATASMRAAYRLRQLQVRDSIRAAAGKATSGARVLVGPSFPANDRAILNSFGQRIAQHREGSVGAVDHVFIIDTLTVLRGRNVGQGAFNYTHALPTADYNRCMSIGAFGGQVATDRVLRLHWFESQASVARFSGPCFFYDRFGAPGPQVDRWLRGGGWAFGMAGTQFDSSGRSASSNNEWDFATAYDVGWHLREFSTLDGFRCITGDAAPCVASVLEPSPGREGRRVRILQNGLVDGRPRWWYNATIGSAQSSLLADMALLVGDDKFRKFWTSALPPAESFSAATGQDLGAWTVDWARRSYGEHGRGPSFAVKDFAWALAFVALALGAAIAASSRRQVA